MKPLSESASGSRMRVSNKLLLDHQTLSGEAMPFRQGHLLGRTKRLDDTRPCLASFAPWQFHN